ncbi:SDR family NAD(P)-dependent oxidoreductase [Kamptonema cortianum]|nr:SDR family NAD(P)-dependent oxidoreductase [Geitlerinema splendidum]MDK3158357.1 SDR family NAD(P)-dependent oxidoreductase [Kamptonema cortianum]
MSKRIVVTGASSGIGAEVAIQAAKHGHQLILVARREELLQNVADKCRAGGSPAVAIVVGDVCKDSVVREIASSLKVLEGEPVLINNAGFANMEPFLDANWEEHASQIEVNLTAAIHVSHAVLPQILEHGSGMIVNVLSVAAEHTFPAAAVYSATKAGLMKFGRCLLGEYRGRGLRVTNILPGSVDTPLWENQGWSPPREQMLTSAMVARSIVNVIELPKEQVVERIDLAPPLGIL